MTNIRRNSHTGQQEFLTQGGLAVLASALADEAAGRDKVVQIVIINSLQLVSLHNRKEVKSPERF